MKVPDEVAVMLRLKALGWGVRRIATELGCSHMTVRRYLDQGGWIAFQTPRRSKALDGLEDWLAERFRQHRGNADVVRQELLAEHGMAVSTTSPVRRNIVGGRLIRQSWVVVPWPSLCGFVPRRL